MSKDMRFVNTSLKRVIIIMALALAACAKTPQPGIEVRTVDVVREVARPCPVTVPERPGQLARPLPTDAVRLAATLALKLAEWAGPGGYGERADAALKTCTKDNR